MLCLEGNDKPADVGDVLLFGNYFLYTKLQILFLREVEGDKLHRVGQREVVADFVHYVLHAVYVIVHWNNQRDF